QQAANSGVRILVNTPELQAVRNDDLLMGQAVFYQAGEVELLEGLTITATAPCVLILQRTPTGKHRLTVADPNRELGSVHLRISAKVELAGEGVHSIWQEEKGMSDLLIELPKGQYAGSSVGVEW
ncbi:MAG: polysaccharide lyase beta-sandwich domain-containing protein, partial [Bacteroidota bacterium]